MLAQDFTTVTKEDIDLIAEAGGFSPSIVEQPELASACEPEDAFISVDVSEDDIVFRADKLIYKLARTIVEDGPDAYDSFVNNNYEQITEANGFDPRVSEVLMACFKYAISRGSGRCADTLGSIYCSNGVLGENWNNAETLFHIGMDLGFYRSTLNLGYIYEYGRTGVRDVKRAYEYYTLAAALWPTSESVYKLGDMYANGDAVERDMLRARTLWEHSLDIAESVEEVALASIRIAPLLIDRSGDNGGAEFDPKKALDYFQKAEIGIRRILKRLSYDSIYYQEFLDEALDGQAKARAILDEMEH